ncbi:MAG TPA: hypothetical protein PLA65_17910 [Spirochaetota bacterium]|nr:hypothetical protein [Spirochaetota bacterium]HPN13939.1 hypothetical protein [Spirochaetota bacterium]
MNRRNVKVLMEKKGVNYTVIARELQVTPQSVYEVMRGTMKSRRIEAALEDIFELPIDQIRTAWNTLPPPRETNLRAIADRVNREFGRGAVVASAR